MNTKMTYNQLKTRRTSHCGRIMRYALMIMMMMVVRATGVWGQTDGVYNIANFYQYNSVSTTNNWYLVPTQAPSSADNIKNKDIYYSSDEYATAGSADTPFLTTYQTYNQTVGNPSPYKPFWVLQSVPNLSGYYYIIHALTGKYMVYEPPYTSNDYWRRKSVHLQETSTPGDNAKFQIIISTSDNDYYNIIPFSLVGTSGHRFLNPAGSQSNYYRATGGSNPGYYLGLVGVYNKNYKASDSDDGRPSNWRLEIAHLSAPTISDVDENTNTFTIRDSNSLPEGYTIRYTTGDGSQAAPTATTGIVYDGPVTVDANWTVKAVVVRYGIVLTDVATKSVTRIIPKPIISFDYLTGMVSISCITSNAAIYYNTGDGSQAAPTTSTGTLYETPFNVANSTTVKAISSLGDDVSAVTTLAITQVATPTIQNNGSNAISITSATPGATIYYTTDGSNPTTSSTEYTTPLWENVSGVTIKAIAVKENMITSAVGSGSVTLQCEEPVIVRTSNSSFTVTCPYPTSGVTIYYTTDGSTPTTSSNSTTSGGTVSCSLPATVKAIAAATNYSNSTEASANLTQGMGGDGSVGDPYTIEYQDDVTDFITKANTAAGASLHYKVTATGTLNFSGANITLEFSGIFDGGNCILTGLTDPLFNTVDGGTVKNVTLKNVNISSSAENVGAIAGVAKGYSRIYNCGILPNDATFPEGTHPYVSTSGNYAGGIVGKLDGDSRVINCYSYADVSASTIAAGIVGNNTYASTAAVTSDKYADLRTAVVNCMFYGDITGGSNRYPVYGGEKIVNNTATGINNYDFYRSEASVGSLTDYNCSWPALEEYLTHYEFYRNLLNSNRELCGWWVGAASAPSTMATTDVQAVAKDASLMAKWVLDPSIAPYPILKSSGFYSSPVNRAPRPGETNPLRIDPDTKQWVSRGSSTNTEMKNPNDAPETDGRSLGKIAVNIKKNSGDTGTSKDIIITAMDVDNNDFCYGKIQLPYYNSIFGNPAGSTWDEKYGGNYKDEVVVGWEITGVTGGTAGTLTKDWETGYNFADRNCTNKDKERVFAQGGYYYVPYGVSAITITAKWATAIYLDNGSDHSYDRVNFADRSNPSAGIHFAPAGNRPTTLANGKTVVTGNIKDNIPTGSSVYDKAIVLVGNHQYRVGKNNIGSSSNACTIMSADFDLDDEPDYSLIWQLGQKYERQNFCPIRFDFLPVTELGLAMRIDGSTQYFSLGCYRPLGHFEVTETSLIHFGQFEFSNKNRTIYAPLILNGGIYDQYTKGHQSHAFQTADDKIDYVIVGGNVRMPSFTPGAHVSSTANYPTRHCAVNAIGGNIDYLYLTGNYNNAVTPNQDNPHCYIDGGKFIQVVAAGKEGIDGDVYFNINHTIINEFYGGSTLADKLVMGNINVNINNSNVTKYCGGPKFGNMNLSDTNPENNKTVTTNAKGTTFGVYYGGGNGGTSYVQHGTQQDNTTTATGYNWNATGTNQGHVNDYSPNTYINEATGYQANYEMEIVNVSTGTEAGEAVFRTYFYAAQFSATNTGPITNNITDCKILTNFYGGGNLGGVKGNVTSTLTDCTVNGSAFGAGYSASAGTVTIYNNDKTPPSINVNTAIITPQSGGTSTTYYWTNDHGTTASPTSTVGGKNYFYTEVPLTNLGAVTGNVILNLNGTTVGTAGTSTKVKENTGIVFGGGDESDVSGNTTVTMTSGYVMDRIYGGGNKGNVGSFTTTLHSGDDTHDGCIGKPNGLATANTGKCTVEISGGQVGPTGMTMPDDYGYVFGAGRGETRDPAIDKDIEFKTYVYETDVTIRNTYEEGHDGDPAHIASKPLICGGVYGGSERGRVLHDTNVKIQGGQIGWGKEETEPYAESLFINPATATLSEINTAAGNMTECASWTYDKNTGTPYDEHAGESWYASSGYGTASTTGTDGHTFYGNVFGGGSGYFPYEIGDNGATNGYEWLPSAGLVEGDTHLTISGGHILTNAYGGNELTDVTGTCYVTMTGGTLGVPRTLDQIAAHPVTCYLFGAGKGDQRIHFNKSTNVGNAVVNISGGIIYGSVFGGGEDGHVKGNVTMNISETDATNHPTVIGTLGTSYVDGNVFGAGRGFSGDAYTAGNVAGSVTMNITGGRMLGSVYGGGRLGSVGYGLYDVGEEDNGGVKHYGEMRPDHTGDDAANTTIANFPRGYVTIDIRGGTIGNNYEYVYPTAAQKASNGDLRNTSYDTDNKLLHTKGGNVFAGGMGRREKLDGVTPIDALDWRKLGNVKSTKITVSGGTIKSCVFGGGEIGAVVGTHTTADSKTVGTEVIINGGTIGTQIPAGSGEDENTYFFGNVFGGGYGTEADASLNITDENKLAALVSSNTSVKMTAGTVRGSVYGGGNVACVGGNADVSVSGGEIGYNQVNETDNEGYVMFGNWRMGNVFGSGRGSKNTIIAGIVKGNTNINISEAVHENNPTFIYHNVYGGGALGSVGTFTIVDNMPAVWTENTGTATINITGGTIGISGRDNGMVNGSSRGDISAPTGTPAVDVYDRIGWINNSVVNVSGTAHIKGSLYGGGENGHNAGNATVTMSGGTVGIIDPNDTWYSFSDPTIAAKAKRTRGNVFGGGCGTDTYESDKDGNGTIDANEKDFHNPLGGIIMGNATVNISGGTVRNNVYGGGSMGSVDGNTTITVTGGRLGTDGDGNGSVCGGPKGLTGADIDAYTGGNSTVTVNYSTTPTGDVDTNNDGVMNDVNLIAGSVFGGGEAGIVKGSVTVNMEKGLVLKDVYGGGALAHTNTNNVTAGLGTASPTLSSTKANKTTVSLLGGTINGFAYGGGLGSKPSLLNPSEANIPAYVYGDVKLNLNGMESGDYSDGYSSILEAFGSDYAVKSDTKGCVVRRVFGCNNVNGTPKGDVKVNVWATQHASKENVNDKCAKESGLSANYDVNAVYGGGNEAAYNPVTGKKTEVDIYNCSSTSIEYVYGGGNAAAVPSTHLKVYGAYEIYNLFGGGNGKDALSDGSPNPGADVTGDTNVELKGGRIHEAYGGSNTLGNIVGSINIASVTTGGECTLSTDKIVAAGKNADIEGSVNVILDCVDGYIPNFFAGADQANVKGDINMTITSGHFGNVFGGNNLSGVITGHIKLNIEETNCTPIIIDNLYLGGNQAAYSKYGYYVEKENGVAVTSDGRLSLKPRTSATDTNNPVKTFSGTTYTEYTQTGSDVFTAYDAEPELNVISCTSIGNVYGGGYGAGATMYANPTVNINMIPGAHASTAVPTAMTSLSVAEKANPNKLGVIGNVFGGGNEAKVEGNTTVNIGMTTTVTMTSVADDSSTTEVNEHTPTVLGAFITGNVFGGGDEAEVTGDTHVNICGTQVADPDPGQDSNGYTDTAVDHSGTTGFGVSIGNSVYGGGNAADVKGNTFVTFAGGYVFNGVFGGGLSGSVGTFTTSTDVTDWGHTANHDGCIGKPTACASGTGTCYVVVSGGQIGPVEVATEGMTRTAANGGPVPQGWVWGGGCGLVEDPVDDQDTHFKTYVNNTDVTIKGTAFILESIIGGGEFGRVLNNTLVKIEGGQIGVGENKTETVNDVVKPVAYTEEQWTEAEAAVRAGDASRITTIAAAMPECSHFPYGRNDGTNESPNWVYDTYDPYADEWKATYSSDKYVGGSTDNASDGKTWIGCVFAGGSGYMPYVERNSSDEITDYDWVPSAGWVGGDTELRISGGHILTNVYGGNEYTDVKGKCKVTMTGGTIGVPRTVDQILAHPLTCYLFGAGKGDPRVHFNKATDVGDVEINITGGTIFGSVFGGGEDGHVMRDVKMTIGADGVNGGSPTGPFIGTWGTSYVDGNVFGGGRGFTGEAYTAGNIGGSVKLDIKGGTMLGSIYGGGRLGSVGYGLFESTDTSNYGVLQDDNIDDKGNTTNYYREGDVGLGRGHIDITISGGTIGNDREYIIPKTGEGGNTPNTISETDFTKWTTTAGGDWDKWKQHNNIPRTEFDTSTGRLLHTKGGNVFAGGMGNLYKQDGMTPIDDVKWWKLGCVKSTTLTIKGGTIRGNVYGGGEIGWVGGTIGSESKNVSTEVNIYGDENTQIGTEVKDASNNVQYTYGSVFGGGYGNKLESITDADNIRTYPKFQAGRVKNSTKVDMKGGNVLASVYGGGEMANVGFGFYSYNQDGLDEDPLANASDAANTYVTVSGGTIGKDRIVSGDNVTRFGGATMGNVYGGGSGLRSIVRCGLVLGNTNVNISGSPTIYHNVYGGGAYGTVGDYNYETQETEATQNGVTVTTKKVFGIHDLHTSGTGVANITITGGTLGTDGCNNGMVFGSSRGDVVGNEFRDDYAAWVYDTHVTIGNSDGTGPSVKGSVYGSGENGHVFHDTDVLVQGGTIGIAEGVPVGGLSGAAYSSRGNVYGAGCGSDTYKGVDGKDYYKPLAGVVYGNTSVRVTGGTVVHNVYGAGSMGSVGKTTTTGGVTTTTGGSTNITVSGGTIGVSGTVGDGCVFGAARGDETAFQTDVAMVRRTNVNITNGNVKGNVYGGGELGDVGTIVKNTTDYEYSWKRYDGSDNVLGNNTITDTNTNTGICTVTISGGTIGTGVAANADGVFANGNVYGAGKGSPTTWWCEKAIAYATNVTVTDGTIKGTVYGGGEVGRVEDDTKVVIGTDAETGTEKPNITGSVFGGGAGLATHGYSALVRGDAAVTVQGAAKVGVNVYGGGEIASVGRFKVENGLPTKPKGGGSCTVNVKDNAVIGTANTDGTGDVYGSCKGVTPTYVATGENRSKSMQLLKYKPSDGSLWSYYNNDASSPFIWRYYATEEDYLDFLKTLALASNTDVTIGGSTVNGSVYGGGQRGVTLGGVDVNITGGNVGKDVYGGGALANTNASHWHNGQRTTYVELDELYKGTSVKGYYTKSGDTYTLLDAGTASGVAADKYYAIFKTNVNLTGGTINRNVYGGGLGQLAKDAVGEVLYTSEDEEVIAGTKNVGDVKTPAVAAQSAIPAKVYGDVLVSLNKPAGEPSTYGDCEVDGNIFGCNNLNGSPQGAVTVHVYNTVAKDAGTPKAKPAKDNNTYEVNAVYGGGNLAAYTPDYDAVADTAVVRVIIDGCGLTSIRTVYGGGNAASVPATEVTVNGTYEIGQVFGGGNGKDNYQMDGKWYDNPGANVGYKSYRHPDTGTGTEDDPILMVENTDPDATTKEARESNGYAYGIGKAHAMIYGGTVHEVFGGSNSRGNVRVEARTTLDDQEQCDPYNVGEAYGGGKNALMDGDAVLDVQCISGLAKAYGGAANADVNGDIVLNIVNGTYGQVFGGNDQGGCVRGTITVNINETGCRPVIIGELYGGGCEAPYSVYGYDEDGNPLTELPSGGTKHNDPVVNVNSFTSIGNIFGGGYGEKAKMVASPEVNINVYEGKYYNYASGTKTSAIGHGAKVFGTSIIKPGDANYDDAKSFAIPSHALGKIGAINNVFGGGNAAEVVGNPKVNIGTEAGDEVYAEVAVVVGETEVAGYYTRSGEGTNESPYVYSGPLASDTKAVSGTTYYKKTIKGADIRGNVFGGGNNAEVTGNTIVTVGKKQP